MALEPWRIGKVIKIEQQTHSTRRFFIQIPELEKFDFKPGQFVTLDLPIHEKPNKRWRSYSIASWPDGTNVFELCIVLLDDGMGTNYLFNEIKEGSEITLRGPVGVFTLPEPIDKDLYLICTGTGIAPFRSMIHHIISHNIPHKDIHLIFGCRKFGDALYANELKDLMRRDGGFFFHTCYSREEPENLEHLVRIGYVHQVYEEMVNEGKQKNGGELLPASFFICGWKNMIDEAKQRIQALGYDRKSIHQELYG
jgi:ferredoxin-NADP reductase